MHSLASRFLILANLAALTGAHSLDKAGFMGFRSNSFS
jgi:hypothetical protein